MATSFTTLVPPKQAESIQTTQYTAVGVIAIIDKFTVTNTSASNVSFSVNIISTGSAGDSNLILKEKTIPAGYTYSVSECVGQILNANDQLSTIASASSALTIRVSGREIS